MLELGLTRHDPGETLRDHALVFEAVMQCLGEGDHREAQEVLVAGLHYMNKSRLVRRYGIPRRTLYNLLSHKSVPTLELVAKVCYALKQEALRAAEEGPRVDSRRKNARMPSRERKALPVGPHPRL